MNNRKVALVTGATSGIGLGIAKKFLEQGNYVVINYSANNKQAEEVKEQLRSYTDRLLIFKADVSNEKQVISMFTEIKNKFGGLDYLVNNAGVNTDSEIENFNYSFQAYKKTIKPY